MEKNVCIVNFNTPELTKAAILSLWKNTPDAKVTVFDNSTERPFVPMDNVYVIDNTEGQVINFDEMLSRHPNRIVDNVGNYGTAKHSNTIQKLFELFPGGFLLLDSDVLIKRDVSELFDDRYAYVGPYEEYKGRTQRILPMICWFNVPKLNEAGVRYFDETKCHKLNPVKDSTKEFYDTGASFLLECNEKNVKGRIIEMGDYVIHLGGGSYKKKSWREWLDKHKHLYMEDNTEQNKNNVSKEYLVVIPYFSGGAQGRELEYAVAGWRKHFKERYKIVLVGDYHPVVDSGDDIIFIECERVGEQSYENYRAHIDFVKKFKAVRKVFPDSDGFIFVADDCYAVNDFDIIDVMTLRQNGNVIDDTKSNTPWQRERCKTKHLLEKEGYPTRNFTTHIPAWFEWDKLEALWERYDMEHNSYIFEDLYFNIYYPTRIPLQLHIDYDNCKCGVYRSNPRIEYIDRAFSKKIWIQNGVEGWIPALESRLAKYYNI